MLRAVTSRRVACGGRLLATGGLLWSPGAAAAARGTAFGRRLRQRRVRPGKRASPTEIVVSVKDGKVSPKPTGSRCAWAARCELLVTSDVDDEVHVHGYDIEKPVAAGRRSRSSFTADQTGVFEVETHESELLLLQLEVQ